jgi:hypothetical protein
MTSKIVYIKAVLFFVFLFLAAINLMIFFFVGVIGSLVTGSYLLFLGGLFYFFIFVILTFIARKLEPAWEEAQAALGFKPKPKTTKEAIKETAPSLALLLVSFIVYCGIEWYFTQFPSSITSKLAHEMLGSILTIDGILLGFYGVVLAQFLWAIHSKGNIIYEQLIANKDDECVVNSLIEDLSRLSKQRSAVIIGMFYAAMPILASFLLCLMKLPLTNSSGLETELVYARTILYDPLASLVTGIILLVAVSLMANLLPKRGRWPAVASATS